MTGWPPSSSSDASNNQVADSSRANENPWTPYINGGDKAQLQAWSLNMHPRTEPAALFALVLAMFGFIIPFIPAIIAIFVAGGARRNIEASSGSKKGKGLATAAIIISSVALILAFLVLIALAFEAKR